MQNFDVLIIGGGAAGLCAAIKLKEINGSINIAVVEQLPRVGKKLITTGNGRCNITNKNISTARYHSENPKFCEYALSKYDLQFTKSFFEELGVVFTFDEGGRAYPYSLQAASVVDALRFGVEGSRITVFTETKVSAIRSIKSGYQVSTDKEELSARCVLLASGLLSGGKKIGSDGSVVRIMKSMGYKTVKMTPAIVQIKTETQVVRQLKGIKVNADVTLASDNKKIRREYGEVLFCDYGLSGPPMLQLSRAVERTASKTKIILDFMPEFDEKTLENMLKARKKTLKNRNGDEFLTGMLNKRVGQVLSKLAGIKPAELVISAPNECIKKLVSLIKHFEINVTGTTGFENSQVTAGGLDTSAFDPKTMMSKQNSGLFAAGEILDVDGDCGGFNLQWAWSSAFCAADAIARYLEKNK